jgi:hypothetical protein
MSGRSALKGVRPLDQRHSTDEIIRRFRQVSGLRTRAHGFGKIAQLGNRLQELDDDAAWYHKSCAPFAEVDFRDKSKDVFGFWIEQRRATESALEPILRTGRSVDLLPAVPEIALDDNICADAVGLRFRKSEQRHFVARNMRTGVNRAMAGPSFNRCGQFDHRQVAYAPISRRGFLGSPSAREQSPPQGIADQGMERNLSSMSPLRSASVLRFVAWATT